MDQQQKPVKILIRNANQNSYKMNKKFMNSKLPNQPKSQVLFHKKSPSQDFVSRTFDLDDFRPKNAEGCDARRRQKYKAKQ